MEYIVNLTWDNEANVWYATSDDVPGLIMESESYDTLLARVRRAVPELLELNCPGFLPGPILFVSKRREMAVL